MHQMSSKFAHLFFEYIGAIDMIHTQPKISVRIRQVIFRLMHNIGAMICKESFCRFQHKFFYQAVYHLVFCHCPNILCQCGNYKKKHPESASAPKFLAVYIDFGKKTKWLLIQSPRFLAVYTTKRCNNLIFARFQGCSHIITNIFTM